MIKEWVSAFNSFIMTDVKNKKETKELAVLIRLTCIIFAIYYLVIGISIAFFQHYYLGLFLVAAIGLLVGTFILTYENRTSLALILLNIIIIIFSTTLAIQVGYEIDFHICIFINILLVYFNKSDKMKLKKFYCIALCIFLMCLTQFCEAWTYKELASGAKIYLRTINMLLVSVSLAITAYSYCMKFNQAEEKLRKINDNLERMANLDTLTGLSNRRHMNEYMTDLVFEYNRSGKTFTIAIGDIDFFKKVNDTYGHDTGDYVLTSVANQFTKYMNGKGHVARWGGEEFLFAFENMPLEKAAKSLDELRLIIQNTPMKFKEYNFNVTMTYGMEEFNDRLGIEATINRADNKLYKGKEGGRNRVVI